MLREDLEKAKGEEIIAELSKISGERQRWSEALKREEAKFAVEREKFELLLEQDRSKLNAASTEIERQRRQNE